MKGFLPLAVWIHRALDAAVIIMGIAPIAIGLDTTAHKSLTALADEGPLPDLHGAIGWLNSAPLNHKSLRGKVVLVDFWTYTCIYSLRPSLT